MAKAEAALKKQMWNRLNKKQCDPFLAWKKQPTNPANKPKNKKIRKKLQSDIWKKSQTVAFTVRKMCHSGYQGDTGVMAAMETKCSFAL